MPGGGEGWSGLSVCSLVVGIVVGSVCLALWAVFTGARLGLGDGGRGCCIPGGDGLPSGGSREG